PRPGHARPGAGDRGRRGDRRRLAGPGPALSPPGRPHRQRHAIMVVSGRLAGRGGYPSTTGWNEGGQMEQRTLGDGGPKLSVVGLGRNNLGRRIDADASAAVVHAALDAGIPHFDTAEMYGEGKSEEFLAAALGSRRDEVVIATKFTPRPA